MSHRQPALVMFGTDEQKAKWLPGHSVRRHVTSFALTEQKPGRTRRRMQTRAQRDGDVYVLNGASASSPTPTGAGPVHGDVPDRSADPGAGGVSAFLVPRDLPGLSVGKPEKKMGQQGAHICDVMFDNRPGSAENRLGPRARASSRDLQGPRRGRCTSRRSASESPSVSSRLRGLYASQRPQFGQPISSFQLVQGMIADSKTEAMAARALTLESARKRDTGAVVTFGSRRPPSTSPPRWSAGSPTGRANLRRRAAMSPITARGAFTATSVSSASRGHSQIQQVVIARETIEARG